MSGTKDLTRYGGNHLELPGCIINTRAKLADKDGREVTSIEILPDSGWVLEGYIENRVIRRED
jgi:hypothetical protein